MLKFSALSYDAEVGKKEKTGLRHKLCRRQSLKMNSRLSTTVI
jgi:hypothetical protein